MISLVAVLILMIIICIYFTVVYLEEAKKADVVRIMPTFSKVIK
jgi:hypothetical protein